MLDLLLVNPGNVDKMYQGLALEYRSLEPPWWCAVLASFVRDNGYDVEILDADADNLSPKETALKIIDYKPKLAIIVSLGCNPSASSTPKMGSIRQVLDFLWGDKSFKVALMGIHPSSLPERTLIEEKVDYIIMSEGFYTILSLLQGNYYKAPGLVFWDGGLIKFNPSANLLSGEEIPIAAWDLLDIKKYRAPTWPCLSNIDSRGPHAAIYTSIGCPFSCHFCQIKVLYNNKSGMRFRSIDKVLKEIDLLVNKYGVKHLRILDELFAVSEKRVDEVLNPIIERKYGLNMWQYARVDTITPHMLEKMKMSGMDWVCFGFESVSDKSLDSINKGSTVSIANRAIKYSREAGMNIIADYIFGLPEDNMQSMNGIFEAMKENLFEYVNLYCCMAYPGSKLYDDVSREHPSWLPDSWSGYSQLGYETKPLPTKYLTSAEVLEFRDKVFKEYFSYQPYLDVVESKFGNKARMYLQNMASHDLKRKILENDK